jgi:hypothetical protein
MTVDTAATSTTTTPQAVTTFAVGNRDEDVSNASNDSDTHSDSDDEDLDKYDEDRREELFDLEGNSVLQSENSHTTKHRLGLLFLRFACQLFTFAEIVGILLVVLKLHSLTAGGTSNAYLLTFSTPALILCCCLIIPYISNLSVRIFDLLNQRQVHIPNQRSVFTVNPFYALLFAFGGWLALLVLVILDMWAIIRNLLLLILRLCCLPCNRTDEQRHAFDRQFNRLTLCCISSLDHTMDMLSSDNFVLHRCTAQLVYCSLPGFITCVIGLFFTIFSKY